MDRFSPPARIDDFQQSAKVGELAEGWDAVVDNWMTKAIGRSDGRFHNPRGPGAPAGGSEAPIPWDAFPQVIKRWFEAEIGGDESKYRAADTLRPFLSSGGRPLRAVGKDRRLGQELELFFRQQDEYCEWFVERTDGRITGIQFTCEGPEYYKFLVNGTAPFFDEGDPRRDITKGDADLALRLYRKHVDSRVQLEDLVWQHDVAAWEDGEWLVFAEEGDYNKHNRWNTTDGAMHLTHPSNTLEAEVNLAADATVLRDVEANARKLICCAGYGGVNRSSDPLIGLGVNNAAGEGKTVSLADPVGLYIAGIGSMALSDPNAWDPTRGDEAGQRILRARINVPADGLQVGGVPLEHGGQVAEHIQMILFGWVVDAQDDPPVRGCENTCCTNPERSDFMQDVAIGQDCSAINWARLAPHLPPEPGQPEPAGAAMPGFAADVDAEVSSKRATPPDHR